MPIMGGQFEGSVRALSDSAGEFISGDGYSPYGNPMTDIITVFLLKYFKVGVP